MKFYFNRYLKKLPLSNLQILRLRKISICEEVAFILAPFLAEIVESDLKESQRLV